ncbi:hypothetical protein BCT11_03170 [Vibrio sp. 10N.222.52.B12]|uniref:restriction endonuclease n=1 Tax=Vibrio sp. 10N.222.52.B12 TaxID=1880840 RepID=UPI000C835711|nr:restriction endonuclease [Vibrio sp. 10N.222.52.B12]PMO34443.1 hypothetical protein BCT11_03170 [Vibrio sp. 10N.222.52.B12]
MGSNHSESRDYELIVHKLISQEMEGLNGVELIEVSHDQKLKGLSGYTHQIDIIYKFRVWKIDLLVLVECKNYKNNVGVDDLLEFKSRVEDLRAHKGLFVTTKGFQSGAIEFADANKIALLVAKGTQQNSVLYSMSKISISERCQRQVDQLIEKYGTGRNISSKITIDEKQGIVIINHNNGVIKLKPGELHYSMLYERSCNYENREGDGFYFELVNTNYVNPNKVIKALLIEEALTT